VPSYNTEAQPNAYFHRTSGNLATYKYTKHHGQTLEMHKQEPKASFAQHSWRMSVWCMSIVGETPICCGSMRNVVPQRLRAKERSQNRRGRCRPSTFRQERSPVCRRPIRCQPIPCQRIRCQPIRCQRIQCQRICLAPMPHKIKQHLPPRITFLRRIRPNLSKYGFHCELWRGRKELRLITSLLS
jgi:hypothetical protein